jgi:hypothetical protein
MAYLIANTVIELSRKDFPTSPVVREKWPMAIVSKSESNEKESLHNNFSWTDIKKILNYFTFFFDKECYLNLSADVVEWQNTKIAICIGALA